jgi:integrase
MSEELAERMCAYIEKIALLYSESEWLFPARGGGKMSKVVIYPWFRKFIAQAGVQHYGRGKGPRVHDFRHTFAVHSLRQMEENGLDLYAALPILSAYLGHSHISATERYLRMTSQVYPHILEQTRRAFGEIIESVHKESSHAQTY